MTQPADDKSDKPNFELVPDPDKAKPEAKAEGGQSEAAKSEAAKSDQAKTAAAGAKSDASKDKADAESGRALAPAGAAPIHPFIAAATAGEKIEMPAASRTLFSRMLDYSAHAAIIVGLIGFAWTVSDHVISRPAKGDVAPVAAVHPPQPTKLDEMAELKLANQKMHDEIRSLKASVDQLRVAARRDTTPEQVRMLSAGLDNVKNSVNSSRNETNAAIAQLNGKVDKLQPGKIQALADRIGHLEHQSIDTAATGSIAKTDRTDTAKATPKPPVKPTDLASLDDTQHATDDDKPQVISGWVVRDVYDGVALIEGKRGTMEVMRGTTIPGAGVVKSIDRHGSGWTVTTTKGQLAFAAPQQQNWRRGYGPYSRGGYAPYRYDY